MSDPEGGLVRILALDDKLHTEGICVDMFWATGRKIERIELKLCIDYETIFDAISMEEFDYYGIIVDETVLRRLANIPHLTRPHLYLYGKTNELTDIISSPHPDFTIDELLARYDVIYCRAADAQASRRDNIRNPPAPSCSTHESMTTSARAAPTSAPPALLASIQHKVPYIVDLLDIPADWDQTRPVPIRAPRTLFDYICYPGSLIWSRLGGPFAWERTERDEIYNGFLESLADNRKKDRWHPITSVYDAGQLASTAIDWWIRARDEEKHGKDAAARRSDRYASLFMQQAFLRPSAGEEEGKTVFDKGVSDGGSIRFRGHLAHKYTRDDARTISDIMKHLRGRDFDIPGPDKYTGDYPLIDVDSTHSVMVREYVPGDTIAVLLEHYIGTRNSPYKGLLEIIPKSIRGALLKNMQHDLTRFEYTFASDSLSMAHLGLDRHVPLDYVARTADALTRLMGSADRAREVTHAATALMSKLKTSEARTAGIDTSTAIVHRDCTTRNTCLRNVVLQNGRTQLDDFLNNHILEDLAVFERVPKRDSTKAPVAEDPHSISAKWPGLIDAYVHDNLVHFDFGSRVALIGEDFYQLMLDPSWRFGCMKENTASVDTFMTANLWRYLIYHGAYHPELHWFAGKIKPVEVLSINIEERLAVIDKFIKEKAEGYDDAEAASMKVHLDATEPTNRFCPYQLHALTYHFDWMWYCRAIREAELAVTTYAKDSDPATNAENIKHFLRSSIRPLDRMRNRFFADMPDAFKGQRLIPTEQLNPEKVLPDYKHSCIDNQHPEDTLSQQAQLHMKRLDYLAAFTKLIQRQYGGCSP